MMSILVLFCLKVCRLLQKQCLLLISVENTIDTKSTITLFDRANSQNKTLFFSSHHHQLSMFTSDEQEPACHTHNNLHQQRWHTAAVTTAKMQHPPLHCAHIHCLVSKNVQQARQCIMQGRMVAMTRSLTISWPFRQPHRLEIDKPQMFRHSQTCHF